VYGSAPRVSLLLPAFDAEKTLGAALESVRRQTEPRFECVIVDDGSRDETRNVARDFVRKDERFSLLERDHEGVVATLNAGLVECRGRFVARMDADDIMHPCRLAEQLELLGAEPGLAGVGCHVRVFPRSSLSDGLRAYESWLESIDSPARVRAEAFVECPLAHPTLLVRREVLDQFRYRDRGWPEDYDLILRLLLAGHELGVLDKPLLYWRDTPTRQMRTSPRCRSERITACKAAFLADSLLKNAERYLLWGYGGTGKALSRALASCGKHPSFIVELHPGRIGQSIAGARVIAPEELKSVPRHPLIVSVAGERARAVIREQLCALGFREGRDYLCAA